MNDVAGQIANPDELSTQQFLNQQADAIADPATQPAVGFPRAVENIAPLTPAVDFKKELLGESAQMHKVFTSFMLTYHLSSLDLVDMKNTLLRVPYKDREDNKKNFYSPLAKQHPTKKTAPPAGVLRNALNKIFKNLKQINGLNVVIMGEDEEITTRIATVADTLKSEVEKCFPYKPDEIVFNFQSEDEDNEEVVQVPVRFDQLFYVTCWINSTKNAETGVLEHNIVVNINMQAGILYDSEDPVRYLTQVDNLMASYIEKLDFDIVALLGVAVSVNQLQRDSTLSLVGALSASENVSSYGPNDLEIGNWSPSKEESSKVFGGDDMLFVKLIGTPIENEEETEGEDDGEEAAAE